MTLPAGHSVSLAKGLGSQVSGRTVGRNGGGVGGGGGGGGERLVLVLGYWQFSHLEELDFVLGVTGECNLGPKGSAQKTCFGSKQ